MTQLRQVARWFCNARGRATRAKALAPARAIPIQNLWSADGGLGQPYCGLMLAAWMTLAHFAVSSATNFVKTTGELANGVPPNSARRALILGSASPPFIS